jgi:hypothetical protein
MGEIPPWEATVILSLLTIGGPLWIVYMAMRYAAKGKVRTIVKFRRSEFHIEPVSNGQAHDPGDRAEDRQPVEGAVQEASPPPSATRKRQKDRRRGRSGGEKR